MAGDAGHHAVRVSCRHHAGGKDVAVCVDQAFDVPIEKPFAVLPLVKQLRILWIVIGQAGIVEFKSVRVGDADGCHGLANTILAANENGFAHAAVLEGKSGADHGFFFTFGKYNAFGFRPHAGCDALEHAGCWV